VKMRVCRRCGELDAAYERCILAYWEASANLNSLPSTHANKPRASEIVVVAKSAMDQARKLLINHQTAMHSPMTQTR
jgi:hypothetical protein